jgi:hypothetical protein
MIPRVTIRATLVEVDGLHHINAAMVEIGDTSGMIALWLGA